MAIAKKSAAPTNTEVADAYAVLSAHYRSLEQSGGPAKGGKSTAEPAAEVETLDEDDIRALSIKELRELAVELELDATKVKNEILEELAAKGYFSAEEEEEGDEEDEDDSDEEEDDEEGEEEISREDLEGMSLKELRELAKEEGHERAAYIKADKDALVDLLAGDEEEDDEEEGEEELSEDDIRAMTLTEVKKLAAELGVKLAPAIAKNRKKIADKIIDEMAEEE